MALVKCMVISISLVMCSSKTHQMANSNILGLGIITLLPNRVIWTHNGRPFGGQMLNLIFQGIRIMAFGILYDFTGNSNVSKVIKAADLIKESWFLNAIEYEKPIDIFIVIGHNPSRTTNSASTFGLIYQTIRNLRPNVPIQVFGGHSHVRCEFRSLLALVNS